jgi:hypothetical protein
MTFEGWKPLSDLVEDVQYIEEETEGKKSLFIEGVFLQGGVKNRNGRIYPVDILSKEVGRYTKESIKENRSYGELGHPSGPQINLDRVSHMIKSLKQSGNDFVGRAKIIDTPMGNIARNLIKEGCKLGVSSRGLGTLKESNGASTVQGDFRLATAGDIVADPSAPNAFVNGIMEGVEYLYAPDGSLKVKEQVAEQIKQKIETAVVKRQLNEQRALELFNEYFEKLVSKNQCL